MNTIIIISLSWVSFGTIFLIALYFNLEGTLSPFLRSLLTLQKFIDRNKGINKTEHQYQTEANPPVTNFPELTEPDDTIKKIKFNLFLFGQILIFHWILYLLICGLGFILIKMYPNLME